MSHADATRFELDERTVRVDFTASLGPLRVEGKFGAVRGTLLIPGADIESATLEMAVDAASVTTGLPMRDQHLRGPSFLAVAQHPFITFRSHRIVQERGELVVAGLLTLCGTTREVITRCPMQRLEGEGIAGRVAFNGVLDIPARDHGVGVPRGLDVLNPIFFLVGRRVEVRTRLLLNATRFLPALLPALER